MKNKKVISESKQAINLGITWIGRILVALSTIGYFAMKNARVDRSNFLDEDSFVFINFIITVAYFLIIVINSMSYNGLKLLRIDKKHFSISVALLCVSAYTINLEFDVFQQFSTWCEISLFAILIPLLTNEFYNKLSFVFRWLYGLLVGFGIVLSVYFTVYLLPTWGIGFIAIIILGLGIHFFAPFILLITFIVQYKKVKPTRKESTGLLVGVVAPILFVVYLAFNWTSAINTINSANKSIPQDGEFPDWYYLSRQLDNNYFVNLVLEGDLTFSTPKNTKPSSFFNGSRSTTAYSDRFRHDPLIFATALLGGELNLDKDIRFKLLEVNYASRHNTEEKLWTGKDLETKKIENNIELFPEYRLAYNEKTITIHNGRKKRWRAQQEALYTFHLPEGSAISSLSLWVNGVERKSRLTTKKKASGAYNNIVGVQMRDPAIAHWKEGNRVTVKVFPCTPAEDRVFKIGITSPLLFNDGELIYSDTYLEGPILNRAQVFSNIHINGETKNISVPFNYNKIEQNHYQYSGGFSNELFITMDGPKLSKNAFCFNGNCYSIKNSLSSKKFKQYDNIYLDINKAWSIDEVERTMAIFQTKNIFVYDGELAKISSANDPAVHKLITFNFNHIQLGKVDSSNSLIITKNSGTSPNVSDLNKSTFALESKNFLSNTQFVPDVYSLNYLNDYWSSLNQLQLINVQYGDIETLKDMVINNRFEKKSNSENTVYIDQAQMMITKADTDVKSEAPDHLLRLFGYNQILKKIGRKFYNREQYEDELIGVANEAFVLSPISSMVVLETDKDYENHGIKKNKNSLSNANMKSGSVPDPHEWALILLGGLILMYLYKRNRIKTIS